MKEIKIHADPLGGWVAEENGTVFLRLPTQQEAVECAKPRAASRGAQLLLCRKDGSMLKLVK